MLHRMPKTSETQPSDDSRTIEGRWWLAVTNRLKQNNRIETQFHCRSNRTEHNPDTGVLIASECGRHGENETKAKQGEKRQEEAKSALRYGAVTNRAVPT